MERKKAEVKIIEEWCKNCGICIHFCRAGVLSDKGSGKPEVTKPEACTLCRLCELHCPDFAIEVTALPFVK